MTALRARTIALLIIVLAAANAAAGPLYWDWPAGRSFDDVILDGAALDAAGLLTAGFGARAVDPEGPEIFWCLVADGSGGYFTGAGHGGQIHHVDQDGRVELLAAIETAEVFSLIRLAGGDLLAGCGPEGQVVAVAADGTHRELGRVDGGYVWDLQVAGDGTVWLAAGSPAALWRLDADGSLASVREFPAQNALDLAWDRDGSLLVATQGPGLVYRVDPAHPANAELIFEAPQNEVRQFIAGPDGDWHVLALEVSDQNGGDAAANGAAGRHGSNNLLPRLNGKHEAQVPRSAIYRLGATGGVPVWSGEVDLMIASWSERWGWLAGGVLDDADPRARLHRLTIPAGLHAVAGWEGGDVMAILVQPERDRLVVCEAHPGGVSELSPRPDGDLAALSLPVDAGRPVRWGRLRWQGQAGDGRLRWSVRTGNRAEPDASWSAWSDAWSDPDRKLPAAASRYLQWRVVFPADGDPWRVSEVSVSAWRENLPPVIADFSREQVRDILPGGLMPRGDNVTQTMRSGLRVEFGRPGSREAATADRAAATRPVRTFSWRGEDPDGDRLVYDLEYRRDGEAAWRSILAGTAESVGGWDTSDVPDGRYQVRLTASDAPDNTLDETLRSHRIVGPVVVDNTPPQLRGFAVERTATGLRVRLRAEDEGVLATAVLLLPDGSSERLDPVDDICDSAREDFDRQIAWPRPGREPGAEPWSVRVEVRDLGGNLAVAEAEAR